MSPQELSICLLTFQPHGSTCVMCPHIIKLTEWAVFWHALGQQLHGFSLVPGLFSGETSRPPIGQFSPWHLSCWQHVMLSKPGKQNHIHIIIMIGIFIQDIFIFLKYNSSTTHPNTHTHTHTHLYHTHARTHTHTHTPLSHTRTHTHPHHPHTHCQLCIVHIPSLSSDV